MSERDWKADAAHENGNYWCKCYQCGESFIGHKRRVMCKLCNDGMVAAYRILEDL